MTTLNRSINTLSQLIEQIDNHSNKEELIKLITDQVSDDTYEIT